MRALAFGIWAATLFAVADAAYADASCDFNIVGTWEATRSDSSQAAVARYRFAPDGAATTLRNVGSVSNALWQETAGSESFLFRLDDPKTPTLIELVSKKGGTTRGTLTISQYDQDTFTTLEGAPDGDSPATHWIRVVPQKYFIVFASRGSSDAHAGGSAFAMLIKAERGVVQSEAFGLFLLGKDPMVGPVPQEAYKPFLRESSLRSDTLLRMEISATEFERSLRVMQTWQKRAKEQALLYDSPHLNDIVFLQQIAESLNSCAERIQLHKLTWKVDDKIARTNLSRQPLRYVEELRQLNGSQHVTDQEFQKRTGTRCSGCGSS